MKKVAIFGNAGGGKSTLAKALADAKGLPLRSLDKMKYQSGGAEVPHADYLKNHSDLLKQDRWVIDGFGCVASAWERFAAADTLIYVDLPICQHGWWITKRLLKGWYVNPEGWPDGSPIIKGTLSSYKVLWICHKKLTPKYRQMISEVKSVKEVYHLTSRRDIKDFLRRL
ncbi:adenylate kinase [Gilvimarinus sp. SDUM040013]|uniref:Adenylate kinase n=1 Tax=Gilvimarinus gilvus TaxID=3058038 RepID=A0ABU4RWR4_9GAMM|nr:adenylate kinase [Gilvimarinus sp. SDUM040013]MDO3388522.1 adenylate kinase [Gilvimarinus sp. SDUM040013]MDX6848606.1 adenylate kinase [Gilvimarinus sp. SDUM040013]